MASLVDHKEANEAHDHGQAPDVASWLTPHSEPLPHFLSVSPRELHVTCVLEQEQFYQFEFENTHELPIAWKVKTNRRQRYMVRPTQGIIGAGETAVCDIVLARLSELPDLDDPKNAKDKFLIQSVPLDRHVEPNDLADLWRENEALHSAKSGVFSRADVQIRAVLHIPSPPPFEMSQPSAVDHLPAPEANQREESLSYSKSNVSLSSVPENNSVENHQSNAIAADSSEPSRSDSKAEQYDMLLAETVKLTEENAHLKTLSRSQTERIESLRIQTQSLKNILAETEKEKALVQNKLDQHQSGASTAGSQSQLRQRFPSAKLSAEDEAFASAPAKSSVSDSVHQGLPPAQLLVTLCVLMFLSFLAGKFLS